jgi:Fe-S cluster assembly ATPase SufC
MGPNGSGKSTVSKNFSGHPAYNVQGEKLIYSKDLLDMSPEVRSHEGLFFSISISN